MRPLTHRARPTLRLPGNPPTNPDEIVLYFFRVGRELRLPSELVGGLCLRAARPAAALATLTHRPQNVKNGQLMPFRRGNN